MEYWQKNNNGKITIFYNEKRIEKKIGTVTGPPLMLLLLVSNYLIKPCNPVISALVMRDEEVKQSLGVTQLSGGGWMCGPCPSTHIL